MDDLTYQRMLAREAKKMTGPPPLVGMGVHNAIVAIEKAHPWWVNYNDIPASKIKRVICHTWTVSTLYMELILEDGEHWSITARPFPDPARGEPMGYLKLERMTP